MRVASNWLDAEYGSVAGAMNQRPDWNAEKATDLTSARTRTPDVSTGMMT